jgi:hypothetical protein
MAVSAAQLWADNRQSVWLEALNSYWGFVPARNEALEKEFMQLDAAAVERMNEAEWFDFLLKKYFPWKFTAPNRLATTTSEKKGLRSNSLPHLLGVKKAIFSFDHRDIERGFHIVMGATGGIKGLGTAGASGLLGVLFPSQFGVVDQFLVKALQKTEDVNVLSAVRGIKNPEQISPQNGAVLVRLLREKAAALNSALQSDSWTPRKVDMVLWAVGH